SSDKYPAYASLPGGGPPFHPNCSKSTAPFIEALASKEQLDLAAGVDDAEKLLDVKDPAEAQRRFKALQLFQQQEDRYPRGVQTSAVKKMNELLGIRTS